MPSTRRPRRWARSPEWWGVADYDTSTQAQAEAKELLARSDELLEEGELAVLAGKRAPLSLGLYAAVAEVLGEVGINTVKPRGPWEAVRKMTPNTSGLVVLDSLFRGQAVLLRRGRG